MSKRRKPASATPCERRSVTDAFEQEAVRRLHERRAEGGTLADVARELDLGDSLLRGWAQPFTAADDTLAALGRVMVRRRPPAGLSHHSGLDPV